MSDFPWLTTIGVLPLIGAVVVAFFPASRSVLAKQFALAVSFIVLALTVAMALQFEADSPDPFQFTESISWIPEFGVRYAVGVDDFD